MLACPDCNPHGVVARRFPSNDVFSCVRCKAVLSDSDFTRVDCPLCNRQSGGFNCRCFPVGLVEVLHEESGECPDCGQIVTNFKWLSYADMSGTAGTKLREADLFSNLREVRYSVGVLLRAPLGVVLVAFLVAIPVGCGVAIWEAVA